MASTIEVTQFTRFSSMNFNSPLTGNKNIHFQSERGVTVGDETFIKQGDPIYDQLADTTISIPVVKTDCTVTGD